MRWKAVSIYCSLN